MEMDIDIDSFCEVNSMGEQDILEGREEEKMEILDEEGTKEDVKEDAVMGEVVVLMDAEMDEGMGVEVEVEMEMGRVLSLFHWMDM